ncbi:hypothetical protein [Azospirillum endophyticum]
MTERDSHALDRDRRGNRGVTLRRPEARLNRQIGKPGVESPIAACARLQGRRTGPYQIPRQRRPDSRPAGLRPSAPAQATALPAGSAGTATKAGTPPSSIALNWRRFEEEAASRHGTPRVPPP